jgi:hypothetical protein
MKPKTVQVQDKMQRGYTYELVASPGRCFAEGFEPELSPAEMLRLGVFGGKYMTDCRREFPKSWFARAKLSPKRRDPSLNFFAVDASQPGFQRKLPGFSTVTFRGRVCVQLHSQSDWNVTNAFSNFSFNSCG